MDKFYDPDIVDAIDKYAVIDKYEWAITDNSHIGRTHTKWNEIYNVTETQTGKGVSSPNIGISGHYRNLACDYYRTCCIQDTSLSVLFQQVTKTDTY